MVLSSEDCRSGIVNKARQMASLIKEQQLKYADINTTSVDEALQGMGFDFYKNSKM